MWRALMLGAALFSFAGCNFGVRTCDPGVCEAGSVCRAGFCVVPADAGAQGGGVGGGGGGGALCANGCEAWQTCSAMTPLGTCVNLTVAIVAPGFNDVVGGNAPVRMRAVLLNNGEAFDLPSIPAAAISAGVTPPSSLLRVDSGVYEGDFQMPNISGVYTLQAGWPQAQADIGRQNVNVIVETCATACAPYQECVPSADGGMCRALNLNLNWFQPGAGQTFGANAMPVLSLNVGGAAFTQPVPFSVDGINMGNLTKSGPVWTGMASLGPANGTRTLVAGWDGGPVTMPLVVNVDAVPPQLGLVVPSDGGFHQRDEVTYAVVTASEALSAAGVMVGGAAMTEVDAGECTDFATTMNARRCFKVDFSVPAFNAFDGGLAAVVSGTDLHGNSGAGDGGVHGVTRLRWERNVVGGQVVQALALGLGGAIYVGTSATGPTGSVVKMTAEGLPDASVVLGDVQSLAVDNLNLYVAFNDAARGNIGARQADTLGVGLLSGPCQGTATSKTYSGIALYRPALETFAVGSINSVSAMGGTGCLYRPTSGAAFIFGSNNLLDAPAVSTAVVPTTAVNVAINGNTASFLRDISGAAAWVPVTLNGGAAPTPGSAEPLTVADPPLGQARTSAGFVLTTKGVGAPSQVFLRDGTVPAQGNLGMSNDKGVAALVSDTEGYVGMSEAVMRFNPGSLNAATPVWQLPVTDKLRTSPVLGAVRPGATLPEGYAVSQGGTLAVFTHSAATSTALWSARVTMESVNTHPTLDCNRARPSSNTGVLYFGTASGNLFAVIVDSPKILETPGAWPKYQRTAGNAGNTDTNFPVNWPGCP